MDTSGFSKNGPGAPSDLWTPVLGPSVLLNMEGADHAALRRKLGPLFAPAFVDGLVAASLGQATARARRGARPRARPWTSSRTRAARPAR